MEDLNETTKQNDKTKRSTAVVKLSHHTAMNFQRLLKKSQTEDSKEVRISNFSNKVG
jgi:hypothetical protein